MVDQPHSSRSFLAFYRRPSRIQADVLSPNATAHATSVISETGSILPTDDAINIGALMAFPEKPSLPMYARLGWITLSWRARIKVAA